MKRLLFIVLLFLLPSALALDVELVKTNPAPIIAGEYADVTIRLTGDSNSEDTGSIVIAIGENQFISPFTEPQSVSKLGRAESITRTFRIFFSEDLNQGYIELPIDLVIDGIKQEVNLDVFVEGSKKNPEIHIGQIESTPQKLLPDTKNNKIQVTLQNLGEKDAELLTAELISNDKSIKPSNSFSFIDSVASLDDGSEEVLEFTMDIHEDATGKIPLTLRLRYRAQDSVGENYETFEKILSFFLPLSDAPLLKVTEIRQLDNFQVGSTENLIRVVITNEGVEEAKEVRARLVPDISYPFTFEQITQYVTSTIPPGASAEVEYKVEVLKSADVKNYTFSIVLESLVEDTRYSREDDMTIQVREKEGANKSQLAYVIVGAIIIVSIGLGIRNFIKKH